MKKYLFLSSILLTAALLTACNDGPTHTTPKGPKMSFLGQLEAKTDCGIFIDSPIDYKNVKATSDGKKLVTKSQLYWPENMPDSAIHFIAYAPYSEEYNKGGLAVFSVATDQSEDEAFRKSDLRLAITEASVSDENVEFEFEHRLAKIIFYITDKAEDIEASALYPSVIINFNDGQVNLSGEKADFIPHLSTSYSEDGVHAYEMFISPQKTTLNFEFSIDGVKQNFHSSSSIDFASGKTYICNRVIEASTSGSQAAKFTENDWADAPSEDYIFPSEEQVLFTERSEEGIYTLDGEYSSELLVFDTSNSQFITSGKSTKALYRVLDLKNSVYLDIDFSGTSFTEGKSISATIKTKGLSSLAENETKTLKIEKVSNGLIYLSDADNHIGYIISK